MSQFTHPYIPNAAPAVRAEMLREIGLAGTEELHRDVPEALRLGRLLNLPPRCESEQELENFMGERLAQNESTAELVSFLGAGCYRHYVPAICDEISSRSEFRTAYAGEPYEDHGRFQALFEYQSLMAELLDMDVVNVPAMDGAQAAATAIRMAGRMTGRKKALVAANIHPDKRKIILNYCTPAMEIAFVPFSRETGKLEGAALETMLDADTAAVYLDYPSFLGTLPENLPELAALAHAAGAECVVGVDPSLLGLLESPANLGADMLCGDIQPLGMHMNYGGGQAGFIASRAEERYINEYPSRLFGITHTVEEGEYGFGDVAYERTSFADREKGKEYVGTQAALWGITAGVYLALMGPDGMRRVAERAITSARYLAAKLSEIPGVQIRFGGFAREFVVDFAAAGKPVAAINEALLRRGVLGGLSLGPVFPELETCALYCCTDLTEKREMDLLAGVLSEILSGEAAK